MLQSSLLVSFTEPPNRGSDQSSESGSEDSSNDGGNEQFFVSKLFTGVQNNVLQFLKNVFF